MRAGQKAGKRNLLGARSSAVEHLTFNQRVVGSIPTGLTMLFNELSAAAMLILTFLQRL